jgi:hypothetical protein
MRKFIPTLIGRWLRSITNAHLFIEPEKTIRFRPTVVQLEDRRLMSIQVISGMQGMTFHDSFYTPPTPSPPPARHTSSSS